MEEALRQQPSNCIKICLFGPESSGKSTLSRKLSQHYNAPLVPEYAREYLQDLWEQEQKICRPKDLLPIACLLYTSPSPRDQRGSRMPSSA